MKPIRNDNPGPGQYTQDVNKVKPAKSTAGKIGTTQRPDIWADSVKVARENPSPGNYADKPAFGKGVKGVANMGSKYKSSKNDNPGPGQYEGAQKQAVRPLSAYGKIGNVRRPDIWENQIKVGMENPSPGNYAVEKQFGKGVKGGGMIVKSSKFAKDNNNNPGPGAYQPDASKLRPKTSGSVRIGQEQRKDLWSEQKKVANLPGPGNYAENTMTFG